MKIKIPKYLDKIKSLKKISKSTITNNKFLVNKEDNIKINVSGILSVNLERSNLFIGTVDGAIEVKEIQLEGKRKMTAKEFIIANDINKGESLL